jgi:hypothetical protein
MQAHRDMLRHPGPSVSPTSLSGHFPSISDFYVKLFVNTAFKKKINFSSVARKIPLYVKDISDLKMKNVMSQETCRISKYLFYFI